jgi:glutamine synthetase
MNIRHESILSIRDAALDKVKKSKKVSDYYGEDTFSLREMKRRISSKTFKAFQGWLSEGVTITKEQADEIAKAMKDWAIDRGADHYTHWFQPLTGLTAEKHDSFISIKGHGEVIEKFSGSKLIQGEPDASSFPSGGIRSTFEARGYTAWDPSSPAFIMESDRGKTLCIPTIFISYHGDSLDKKLPLLRSDEALSRAALKLLRLFGRSDAKKAFSTCGPEQEYFLIDNKFYKMRQDLMLCGRTLMGAPSPKGQQLEDQYFGSIKDRVLNYMCDVDREAYRLGIPLMTRHNEVAPHQYEFAPIFEESNIAADHNQLLMNIMKKIALKHDLVCLLHEKPFAGVNGSGKHLNWSLSDDQGNNLLNPGETPEENLVFLTVLVCVLRAVHRHSDILRASVALAGSEHRLGANEAPPAIISVFLGGQISQILDTIEKGRKKKISRQDIIDLGVGRLPTFNKDVTDRNRTSPFAFTGNKFEFRAVGSSQSIATPITLVNAIIADAIDSVVAEIQKEMKSADLNTAVLSVIGRIITETKPIRFEGNNYSGEWKEEAAKRGLPNEPSTEKALKALVKRENIALFKRQGVFTEEEVKSRYRIWVEMYNTTIEIEAHTLKEMVDANVLPPGYEYQGKLASNLKDLHALVESTKIPLDPNAIKDLERHLADITQKIYYVRKNTHELEDMLGRAHEFDGDKKARFFFEKLKPLMEHIRKHCDELEKVVSDEVWQLPKYREILFIS